ncbi:hypothetical protein F4802DRAFT_557063 [Xylaria palmicola]|nr:hypothetical protein F4802DRAFT_557063 [Xylaria palmicola]
MKRKRIREGERNRSVCSAQLLCCRVLAMLREKEEFGGEPFWGSLAKLLLFCCLFDFILFLTVLTAIIVFSTYIPWSFLFIYFFQQGPAGVLLSVRCEVIGGSGCMPLFIFYIHAIRGGFFFFLFRLPFSPFLSRWMDRKMELVWCNLFVRYLPLLKYLRYLV